MEDTAKLSPPKSIVLCLSGGGLRATFFHLGVVRALKRLNLLDKVTDIVSVSGGSIIAAHLVQHWAHYIGSPDLFDRAQSSLLSLRRWDLRGRAIRRSLFWWPLYFAALQFPKFLGRLRVGRTELLRREYDRFFENQSLEDLDKTSQGSPELHIVSTNLKTGGLCSFTKTKYHAFEQAEWQHYHAELTQVSLAVAASSAFPPVFPPIVFDESMTASNNPGAVRLFPHVLTDGGVYDNTGFESAKLLAEERKTAGAKLSDLILVSDAGSPFQWRLAGEFTSPISLALRTSEIIMKRNAAETLRDIASDDRVGLISIEKIDEQHSLLPMIQKYISRIRTDLDRFSDIEVAALVVHGENKTISHLTGRFAVNQNPDALNEFPISLPSSNRVLAKGLSGSWRVRWWNTFTNFSDFFPTIIIDALGIAALCVALISIRVMVGFYFQLVELGPMDPPGIQSAPTLKPLPPVKTSPGPEVTTAPVSTPAQVNRCLDAIDMKLPVDQVRSLARQCLQSK